MAVYLIATLDTKGAEANYVRHQLSSLGVATVVVDAGCLGAATCAADVSRAQVFGLAGTSVEAMQQQGDRGVAIAQACAGVRRLVMQAFDGGALQGVLGLGGSAGTTIATTAMRALPLGVPKLMVSTLASGNVRAWVADKDITMMNSVVDILGLNRISRTLLHHAAAAMAGMVQHPAPVATPEETQRPLLAITMFGVTTPCAERAKQVLEQAGYEVLVFHATGNGGEAMESLIREGWFAGVLDITTTEIADELCGGVLSAGPTRLTAAAACGIPQVVSVGATDMVNFHARDSVPARFLERKLHAHNASVTLMRTTPAENTAIGLDIGAKLAAAAGPCEIHLPALGVSDLDRAGQPFADLAARSALFESLKQNAGSTPVVSHNLHLNDPRFAELLAHALLRLLATHS